jgi:hypothetical protein
MPESMKKYLENASAAYEKLVAKLKLEGKMKQVEGKFYYYFSPLLNIIIHYANFSHHDLQAKAPCRLNASSIWHHCYSMKFLLLDQAIAEQFFVMLILSSPGIKLLVAQNDMYIY